MSAQPGAVSDIPDRQTLTAFILFIVVGAAASIATRITYLEMAPFWSATARFGLAAVFFWILVLIKKISLPRGRALLGTVIFGILTVGLAFILISWGLVEIPASTYQVLMALVPLFTLFLSALHRVESIHRRGLFGSLLAVIGIALTVGGGSAAGLSLPHVLAIILAALALAEASVLLKRFPLSPALMTNAIGMTVGTVILGAASLVSGETWTVPTQTNVWIAFIYLVVFVVIIDYMLYLYVISKWTASGASYAFVLVPLVTMVLAATLAGEVITINFLAGTAFVLAGVLIGALLPSKTHPQAVEECKDLAGQVLPRCT